MKSGAVWQKMLTINLSRELRLIKLYKPLLFKLGSWEQVSFDILRILIVYL